MTTEPKAGGGRNHEEEARAFFSSAEVYRPFEAEQEHGTELPTKIEKSDIKAHPIAAGETEIILQRHGAYVRDREAPNVGSLSEESEATEKAAAMDFFEKFLSQLRPEERSTVDVLVVASDTQYFEGGRRSYETGTAVKQAAREVFTKSGLSSDQVLSTLGSFNGVDGPTVMPELREPNFLNDSSEFLDFMLKEYGEVGLKFWIAFEEDQHKDVREAMGAEGPDEIADRTGFAVASLAKFAETYHESNTGRRLIIWGATHYDTISPFVKRDLFAAGKETQLLVDYGGGITIDIDTSGIATTELGKKSYQVPLEAKPTD